MSAKKTQTRESKAAALRKQKEARKKTRRNLIIGTLVTLVFGYGFYLLFVPYKGELTFGVCKTFLELHVRHPTALRLSEVTDFGDRIRIAYTQVDSFGEYRMETIQCFFRYPEEGDIIKYGEGATFILERVTINRREVDQDKVDHFNVAITGLRENPPDLTLPRALPDSLSGLQIDLSRFIKPIL